MSNWWEEYPVVNSEDALAATVEKKPSKAKTAKEKPQGNWWEVYPAVRADVGDRAITHEVEADRKRQEERARLHEAHQSVEKYGETATTGSQVVLDVAALANRALGFRERANQNIRDSDTLSQALSERDAARWRSQENPEGMSTAEQAGQYVPFLKQGVRGAARSAGSAILGSKGVGAIQGVARVSVGGIRGAAAGIASRGVAGAAAGATQGAGVAARGVLASGATGSAYGAIGLASAQEANRAYTEGADAGLTGTALTGYVASQGLIEAIPATVMQRMGLGGVEAMIAGPSIRQGVKAGIIEAIKSTGQEIPEELATEIGHAVASRNFGADPEALKDGRLPRLVADTVLQTVLMGAGAGAMQVASGAAQERLARLKEIRAKGFVSTEDAAKEGIEGKNRKERLANADKQIEELTQQSSVPTVGTLPPTDGEPPATQPGAPQVPPSGPGPQLPPSSTGATPPPSNPSPDPATPPAATQPGAAQPEGKAKTFQTSSGSTYEFHPDGTTTRNRAERGDGLSTGPQPRSTKTWFVDDNELQLIAGPQRKPGEITLREVDYNGEKRLAQYNVKTGQYSGGAKFSTEPKPGMVPVEYWDDQTTIHYGNVIVEPKQDPAAEQQGAPPTTAEMDDLSPDVRDMPLTAEAIGAGLVKTDADRKYLAEKGFVLNPERNRYEIGRKSPSTAGSSEETGKTPTTGSPTVSPDAPETETSKGKPASEKQPSEARADEDTRGKGVQYHGARGPITSIDEGYYSSDNIYGGESTFYTTDATDIASGYGRKKPNAMVYRVDEVKPVNHYDMEKKQPTEEIAKLFGAHRGSTGDLVSDALDYASKDGQTSLREVMDEIRNESANQGISKDGVQEIFSGLRERLQDMGYGGMTHVGGLKTGRKPHTVKIYFEPESQIRLTDKDGNVIGPPADAAESKGTAAPPTDTTVDQPDADIDRAIGNFKKSWGIDATATPADKLSAEQQEALDFATSRGQKMAFIDIAKSDKKAPIGSYQRDDKVVLISNALQGDKLWGMIGHEMAHSKGLDEILPADSAELKQMMDEYYASANDDVRKRLKTNKRDHMREGRARMVQKFFEDKAFRDRLMQNNPTLWEKLREAVLKFIGQWTPKDEAKRMLLDELRAAPKPQKRTGKKLPSEMTDAEKDAEVDKLFKPKSEPPKTIDELRKLKFDDVSDSEETEGVGKNKGVTYRRKTYEVTNEDGEQHRYKVTINDRDNDLKVEDLGRTKEQELADNKADYESLADATKQRIKDIGLDDLSDYQKYDVGLFIEGRADAHRGSERSVNVILGGQSRMRTLMDAMGVKYDSNLTWQDVYDFLRKPQETLSEDKKSSAQSDESSELTNKPEAVDDFTAAVNDAFDKRFGAKKPKSVRKDKPQEKKTLSEKAKERKERTSAAKAEKLATFKELLKKKNILKAVYDPKTEAKADAELLAATVELTAAAIDDGVSTFFEYVAWIADNIGEAATRQIAPYLEAGWNRLGTYDRFRGKIDKAGKVADILTENSDEISTGSTRDGGGTPGARNEDLEEGQAEAGSSTGSSGTPEADDGSGSGLAGNAGRVEGTGDGASGGTERGNEDVRLDSGPGGNYRIGATEQVGSGAGRGFSAKTRFAENVRAIRLLKTLEKEDRKATSEEQSILVKYVGWGGLKQAFGRGKLVDGKTVYEPIKGYESEFKELKDLLTDDEWNSAKKSITNAHYTDPSVIRGMWQGLEALGFKGGKIIEPSAGTGLFFGLIPQSILDNPSTRLAATEIDSVSGRIAQQLYQNADIRVHGFEELNLADNSVDLFISNVPFGQNQLSDKKDRSIKADAIHNFFFNKAIRKTRPGGLVAFITSRYSMDEKVSATREFWDKNGANLVGVVRLPGGAFKGIANTDVVTDIIILQKREEGAEPSHAAPWKHRKNVPQKGYLELVPRPNGEKGKTKVRNEGNTTFPVNEYFEAHPEHVVGELAWTGTMQKTSENQVNVEPPTGAISDKVAEIVSSLPVDKEGLKHTAAMTEEYDNADMEAIKSGDWKEDHLRVEGDRIYRNDSGVRTEVPTPYGRHVKDKDGNITEIVPSKKGAERFTALIKVFNAAERLIAIQPTNASDEQIEAARRELNKVYDEAVKEYGPLSSGWNATFAEKSLTVASRLYSLEEYDPTTDTAHKAAIFRERTQRPHSFPTKANSAKDALTISLSQMGRLDPEHVAGLLGKPVDSTMEELGDLVYRNHAGDWELAQTYLSGNVRQKLTEAKALAESNDDYQRNVAALETVQPKDLTPSQIEVRLNSPWIPTDIYEQFLAHLLRRRVKVSRSAAAGKWFLTPESRARNDQLETLDWGIARMPALDIITKSLNRGDLRVYDPDGQGGRIVNQDDSTQVLAKLEKIKAEFQRWLWTDHARADQLTDLYNREINNMHQEPTDGSHLTFPGMSEDVRAKLDRHQVNAVWRYLTGGNMLLAHVVGAGKSWIMTAAAMEQKRISGNPSFKTMIAVPNHLVTSGQFVKEILEAYPSAKVLAATPDSLSGIGRRSFLKKIATGNYDIVVIAHTSFGKIPLNPENERAFIQKQIDDLEIEVRTARAESDRSYEAELQTMIANLVDKLAKISADLNRDELSTYFDDLNIDSLFVDEAHEFKNLAFRTKMSRVPGVNPTGSNMAFDMWMKTTYFNQATNEKKLMFATGTPIANAIAEMYTMQRYLQPSELERLGLQQFDSWAASFADEVTKPEIDPAGGGMRMHSRLSQYINMPELSSIFRQVADVQTADMLVDVLKRPLIEGNGPDAIKAERNAILEEIIEGLQERAQRVRSGVVDKSIDNMLNIVTDGRKAATDIRLIDPSYPDLKGSKVNLAVENIHRIWEETADDKLTQVVWLDVTSPNTDYPFNLYHEIVDKLAALGIPRDEIAIMHDFNEKTKAQLFRAMNKGDVRILLGSTAVMGTGVNVQKKLIASHHLDVPWRPDQLEQRDGRILRRGNTNKKVKIIRYISKGSFDAFMWDKIEQKTSFIRAAMSGASNRVLDASEAEDMSAAEMKAAAADDPNLIRFVTVQAEVNKLESENRGFLDQQSQIRRGIASAKSDIEYYTKRAADFEALIKIHDTVVKDLPEGEIRGKVDGVKGEFTDPKEFADALTTALVNAPSGSNARGKVVFFEYNGLMGQISQPPKSDPKDFEASGWLGNRDTNVDLYLGGSPAGNITRLNNAITKIKERPDVHRETVEQNRLKIPALEKRVQAEWPDAKRLSDLREEQTQLASLVQAGKGDEHKKAVAGKLNELTGRAIVISAESGRYLFKDVRVTEDSSKNAAQNEAPAVVPANIVDAAEAQLSAERSRDREERLRKLRDRAEIYEWDRSINPRPPKKKTAGNIRKRDRNDGGGTSNITPNVVYRTSGTGTPQQSSQASFSLTDGETKEGKRLLDRMKRDSANRKIGPRSILNYLYDVVRAASITGKSQLSRRNPGHYKPREHLVRSRTGASGVIDTHEAGHALSALLRDKDKRILKKYEPDLIALTQMPNSMASGQTAEEGMAEFVRRYIVDYQSLPKALVDDLEADIEKVSPELLAGLKDANRLWQQFLARPLNERLDASKNDRGQRKIGRGFRDAIYRSLYNIIGGDVAIHKVRRELERPLFEFSQALGLDFRERVTDTQADIDNAYQSVIRVPVETQRAIFGDSRSEHQGVSIIAFGDNMFSPEVIQYLRDGGFKVPDDFKHGERVYLTNQSFEQIRQKLGDDWDSFENYGQLRASLERADKKGHQSAWMHENVSMAEAAKAIADMESANPTWIDHFDEVREFFDGLLLVATLSGEYTPEEAVRIRNAWDSYWPLLRQVTPEESNRVGRGGPDPSAGVHRAFGSALPLRNLLEAVEMRTKAAMNAYYTNRMMLSMRKYSDTLHSLKDAPFDIRKAGARLMVPLKMDMKKVASLSPMEQAQMILEYMNKQLQDEADANGDVLDPDDLLTIEDIDISMPWRPIFRATRPGAIQVIGLTENGDRKYYQVTDPLVFDLFSNSGSMDRYATWLARFFAKGIGPWKRALTQNLAFAVRNLPRDTVTAMTMGDSAKSFVPGMYLVYGIVGRLNGSLGKDAPARAELFSRSLESLHQPRHKKVWDSFAEAATEGIVVPGYFDMNFYDRVSEAPGQLSAIALWTFTMFNWATGGRYIAQMSEELQREGAFREARSRGRSYEYAQRQYDQISGNFSQRQPNHATATFIRSAGFLNPGLQIMWGQMKRWADPDPRAQKIYLAKLPALAAWFAVASAINVALVYALFGDDEEKLDEVLNDMRERPDYEQDTTMSVMGTVRLPFEYGLSGAVSSFAWNATEDALLGGSNDSIHTRLKAFLARATQIPGPTDAIQPYLKAAIELKMGEAGYSMYRNDSIVPYELMTQYPVNPELRAYDETPTLYKQIGESLRVSPLKVEYAVGSLLTGTAQDVIAFGNKLVGGKTLAAKDFPIVSRLIQKESTGFRSQAVRELRKAHQEVEAMGVKIKKMGDDAPQELREKYAKMHEASLAYDIVSKMYDSVQEEVEADKTDHSAVEKIERQMTRFARQFLNYRAGRTSQPPEQLKERKHEYYGLQAYSATGNPESENGIASRDKAVAMLKLSGLTLVEAKQLLLDHWQKPDGTGKKNSVREMRGGRSVLKSEVLARLKKLEELFKAK